MLRKGGKAKATTNFSTYWLIPLSFPQARLPCSRAMFLLADFRQPSALIGQSLRSSGSGLGDRRRVAFGSAPGRAQARLCWGRRLRLRVPCAKTNSR